MDRKTLDLEDNTFDIPGSSVWRHAFSGRAARNAGDDTSHKITRRPCADECVRSRQTKLSSSISS